MWGRSSSKPKLIYSTTSLLSGKINVWQQGEERILEVGGYTQSVNLAAKDFKNRVWGRMVKELARRIDNPQSALILGLGGGTVAHLLSKTFSGIAIDGVELDPVVVGVGERYFRFGEIPNLKVIVADAYELVKNPKKYPLRADTYSTIIVDLFLGGGWSKQLEEIEFHQSVRNLLAKEGVVVFNRVSGFDRKQFHTTLSKIFAKIEVVEVGYKSLPFGNTLYLCQ